MRFQRDGWIIIGLFMSIRILRALRASFTASSKTMKGREWGLIDDYEVLHTLGKGSSARVFQGVHVLTGKQVVIKMFKKISPQAVKKEIQINNILLQGFSPEQHQNVRFIELLDTLYDPASAAFTLIYQFYPGVPLNQLIASITYPQAIRTAYIIANTLSYVHSLGFVHRDIKPANILMTPFGPRLFDFGLTKLLGENEEGLKTNNFGTKCYKSPEVIYRMSNYGQAVDVWGLGLVMAEMLLNKRHILQYESDLLMLGQVATLCGLDNADRQLIPEQMSKQVTNGRGRSWRQLANEKNLDQQLVELVRRMLSVSPSKRPSLAEVIDHPVFSEVVV